MAPTAASDDSAAHGLLGLPGVLLEAILLLLPLKLRVRFTTTCKAARHLGTASPVLWRDVTTSSFGHQQSLYLLRWLAAAPRRILELDVTLNFQCVVPTRRLTAGLALQAATLETLVLSVPYGPLSLDGPWLSQLGRLSMLVVCARGVELGPCCGTLPALQRLRVGCGFDEVAWEDACTAVVQPGAIPPSITSMNFYYCTLPELPPALASAAPSLKRLWVCCCAADFSVSEFAEERPPGMQVLSQLTALTCVQFTGMNLEAVPSQLAAATGLERLNLEDSTFGWQASMGTLSQLPKLDMVRLHYNEDWEGEPAQELLGGDACMGDLPQVRDITINFDDGCADKRLPHLASLPQLRHLEVSAVALLCSGNAPWLRELDHLEGLYVILPECLDEASQVIDLGPEGLLALAQAMPELNHLTLVYPERLIGVFTRKLLHIWRKQVDAALPGVRCYVTRSDKFKLNF